MQAECCPAGDAQLVNSSSSALATIHSDLDVQFVGYLWVTGQACVRVMVFRRAKSRGKGLHCIAGNRLGQNLSCRPASEVKMLCS